MYSHGRNSDILSHTHHRNGNSTLDVLEAEPNTGGIVLNSTAASDVDRSETTSVTYTQKMTGLISLLDPVDNSQSLLVDRNPFRRLTMDGAVFHEFAATHPMKNRESTIYSNEDRNPYHNPAFTYQLVPLSPASTTQRLWEDRNPYHSVPSNTHISSGHKQLSFV